MTSVIISLNTLVMHVTKIIFSFFAKLDMLITTIGTYYSHRDRHILGTSFGIKQVDRVCKQRICACMVPPPPPPPGFWGSGENGYLFSGSTGNYLGALGSNLIIMGIQGALPKREKIRKSLHFV